MSFSASVSFFISAVKQTFPTHFTPRQWRFQESRIPVYFMPHAHFSLLPAANSASTRASCPPEMLPRSAQEILPPHQPPAQCVFCCVFVPSSSGLFPFPDRTPENLPQKRRVCVSHDIDQPVFVPKIHLPTSFLYRFVIFLRRRDSLLSTAFSDIPIAAAICLVL